MPGALILINGFPGVGKHAVARELVKLLPNCRFFDTRNLIAAASQLYEADDEAHGLLRKNLKHAIFNSIAQQYASPAPGAPPPPTYVLTDFLSVAARATDRAIVHEFIAFAKRSGFAFIHVILSCGQEENVRRLLCPERLRGIAERTGRERGDSEKEKSREREKEKEKVQVREGRQGRISGVGASIGGNAAGLGTIRGTSRGTSPVPPSTAPAPSSAKITPISSDEAALIQTRMEEEIGHLAPASGLCGEYEIDTTRYDARTTAAVLAEYCLDTLRSEGWWIQLANAPNATGRMGNASTAAMMRRAPRGFRAFPKWG